jgi:hypothetical protein
MGRQKKLRTELPEFNQHLISSPSSLARRVGWFRRRPPTGYGAAFQVLELNLSVRPQALIKYRENPPPAWPSEIRCLSNIRTSDAPTPHLSSLCMCSYNASYVWRYCSYRQIDITFHICSSYVLALILSLKTAPRFCNYFAVCPY